MQELYDALLDITYERTAHGIGYKPDLKDFELARNSTRKAKYKLRLYGYEQPVVDNYEATREAARVFAQSSTHSVDDRAWTNYKSKLTSTSRVLSKLIEQQPIGHRVRPRA